MTPITLTYRVPPIDEAVLFIGCRRASYLEGAIILRHLYPPPTWLQMMLVTQ